MAEIKFSQLTTAAQLTNDDIFALAQMQGGSLSSVKTSMIAVANFLNTQVQYTTAYNTQAKTTAGAINELKQLISLIPQFSIEVVEELPTEDISDTTIYLVPAEDPEVGNYYEEYIHVNNTWELVGTTTVDLSAYYTKLEVDGLLATKASVAEVALKENKSDMPTDVRTIIKDCKTPKNATITNGIAQFECIEENLVKGLKVTMNPIQDLHGYSNPWAGGAGKNKLKVTATTQTINGVTFTVNSDGTVSLSGTASATSIFDVATFSAVGGTAYKLSGCPSGGSTTKYLLSIPAVGYDSGSGYNYTPSTSTDVLVRITIYSGQNTQGLVFKPMICLASAPNPDYAHYEPYENICPISGRTEASVTRTAGEDVETKTHQYSETIYGGVDDFVSGGADSTKKYIELDENSNWAVGAGAIWFFVSDADLPTGTIIDSRLCSNMFKNGYNQDDSIWVIYRQIHIRPNSTIAPSGATAEGLAEFKNWLSTNNYKIQVCVDRATPTTISTSAEEITTVSGTNIISGTEPISECKYTELATVDDLRKIIGGQ